jgi:hypothetical protein
MNMIATNLVPNDEQLHCDHIIGIFADGYGTVAQTKDSYKLKKLGGLAWTFCPICGARLEDK